MIRALFALALLAVAVERTPALIVWWRRRKEDRLIRGLDAMRLREGWVPPSRGDYTTRVLADVRQEGSRR